MNKKEMIEGLADMAQSVETDHEVQMARSELYKLAKYSIKLHNMLKTVDEQTGLDGWVASKITKASDYIGSVYHHLDYDMKFSEQVQEGAKSKPDYLDFDKDGDKKEPMKKALKDKKKKDEDVKEGDNIYHDCAVTFKHKKYGECKVIPGQHTLLEDGTVTHYDATFTSCGNEFVVRNVSTNDMFDVVTEGHSHKPKKKKKKTEDLYKSLLTKNLEEAKATCKDCGKPSYTTIPEEKQKGVDGKVCWKGYKRMGTKKKGDKTVDNCVKVG